MACAFAAGCAGHPQVRYVPGAASLASGFFEAQPVQGDPWPSIPEGELDAESGQAILSVRVVPERPDPPAGEAPAIAGRYLRSGNALRFQPAFPLEPGVRYVAEYRPGTSRAVSARWDQPAPDRTPSTVVEAVYPSAEVLPENLLKFYIHFSAPMSRRQAWDRLQLIDGAGKTVQMPFLELDDELWDPRGRRLTVFIDPGRIKREVRPLEEIGPSLVEGGTFTLSIDSRWEDAAGRLLARGYHKTFQVGPPDRTPPDPARWKLHAPAAGSRQPLSIQLGEALDHGLLLSAIGVEGPDGKPLEGEIQVGAREKTWQFIPAAAWQEGEFQLVIDTKLEDLAGNSIGRPFEVDLVEPVGQRVRTGVLRIPFTMVTASQ